MDCIQPKRAMERKIRRILYTTPWYPSRYGKDGLFIQRHAEAEALLNDVVVITVINKHSWRDYRNEFSVSSEGDLRVIRIYAPKVDLSTPRLFVPIGLLFHFFGYLKAYRYAVRELWSGSRPDIIHVNVLSRAAALPWLINKLYHVPYIITEHWSRYFRPGFPYSKLHLWATRKFVRDALCVCPVSENLHLAMKKWNLENARYECIGNVVDVNMFYPVSRNSCPNVRFFHVSWLRDSTKNVSGLLRAFALLDGGLSNWTLDIVGEGRDKGRLESLSHELGLGDKVRFQGSMVGVRLAEFEREKDCLIMFSHYENQPVAVLEALACGLPVIATNVGDLPNMLDDGRGICVRPGDEIALANTLKTFIVSYKNDELKAIERVSYVSRYHSPEAISRRFDDIYTSAIN